MKYLLRDVLHQQPDQIVISIKEGPRAMRAEGLGFRGVGLRV